jgi:hypothetical protein
MKNNITVSLTKSIIALILVVIITFGVITPALAQDNSIKLFSENRGQSAEIADGLPGFVTRARSVEINPAAMNVFAGQADNIRLNLNLFSDTSFDSQIHTRQTTTTGSTLLKGVIPGAAYSEVTLIYQDNTLTGGIAFNDQYFRIATDAAGNLHIAEINQLGYPEDLAPIEPDIEPATTAQDSSREVQDSAGEIDVMVVYTTQARSAVGGTTAMQSLINLAMSETNTGFANSQVTQRFVLVHTHEFAYTEQDYYTMLMDLQDANGDALDPVHSLRNSYSADLVIMLVANTQYCGLAYLMTNPSTSFAPYAFSVVSINCASGYYSFAHEAGHNMGSQHNRQNASQPGAYDFSYGYYNEGAHFRTIMAYNCPSGCTRINYWSNPYVNYSGLPTGVLQTSPNAAYNTLSLNQTASYVANFRVRPFDPPTDFIFLPMIVK